MFKIFFSVILITISVASLPAQYSYMPGDKAVDMLIDSYISAGKIFPSSAFPLSKKDLYHYAERIGDKTVLDIINYVPGNISFEESVAITYEQYFRTKEAWPDFSRIYLKQPDFINLTLNAQNYSLGGVYIQAGVKQEYFKDNIFLSSNFYAHDSTKPGGMENGLIREGYFYYMFDSLDFVFGRNKVHYGDGNFSTLFPSKDLPFIDALSYKFNLGNLQMQSYIATLENREAVGGDVVEPTNAEFGKNTIIATMHRFEYSWNKVRAGIGAQSFLVRSNNGFLLGDFFPVFSWHNTVVGEHNMSLIADLSIVPYPGIELYMMGGVDDINATDLIGINDTGLPTIPAWIAGVVYHPTFTDFLSKISFEAGETHYLWGNFYWDESAAGKVDQNAFARAIYRYKTDSGITAIPMTSPYGPGATWFECKIASDEFLGFKPNLDILYLIQIKGVDLVSDTYYRDDEAMAAAPRIRTFNANLNLSYQFADWNTLYTTAGYYNQDGSQWMEFTLGGILKFRNVNSY